MSTSTSTNTLSRSLHEVGLAAWFGGTLANATALDPAAAEADTPGNTGAVASTGWDVLSGLTAHLPGLSG